MTDSVSSSHRGAIAGPAIALIAKSGARGRKLGIEFGGLNLSLIASQSHLSACE